MCFHTCTWFAVCFPFHTSIAGKSTFWCPQSVCAHNEYKSMSCWCGCCAKSLARHLNLARKQSDEAKSIALHLILARKQFVETSAMAHHLNLNLAPWQIKTKRCWQCPHHQLRWATGAVNTPSCMAMFLIVWKDNASEERCKWIIARAAQLLPLKCHFIN